jgi:hypothetical protein
MQLPHPMAPSPDMLPPRFTARMEVVGECWEWRGQRDRNGYGHYWHEGRYVLAHRFAFVACFGALADGLTLDHLCRNPSCVRPDHLEAVSHRENCLRAVTGASAVNARKTHCLRGHPLTADNIYTHRGRRVCRQCQLIRTQNYRRRKKERQRKP